MIAMKRFALLFFMFVFAVNTFVLAANANACKMERGSVTAEQSMPDMPNCHMKKSETEQKPSGKAHCKGICFCQNVINSHHVLPFAQSAVLISVLFKGSHEPIVQAAVHSRTLSPLLRPPIMIS